MGTISRTTTWSDGQILNAGDLNTELDTAYNEINGNLDSDNLANNAVNTAEITDNAVTKAKVGTMEYIVPFVYNPSIAASAENLRQFISPFAEATATKLIFGAGGDCSAFAIDIGMADMETSSIGSSFLVAGSANVTSSANFVTADGAAIQNTVITANSKIILTAKTFSDGCGEPLWVNLYMDV
jgi:hypothetical protein